MGSLPDIVEYNLNYPVPRRDETLTDNYYGLTIADPYRWLEDPDAEEVIDYVESQRKLTDSVLSTCHLRGKLREQITKLYDYPKYDSPFKRGDKYFFFHNTGLQAQSVMYFQRSLEGTAEVVLDPNKLSNDGTIALSFHSFSENAEYLAIGLSSNGSDWVNIKVMRVEDKTFKPDNLSWVKFSSVAWTHDNKGFFYSRYPAPNNEEKFDAGTETDINLYHQVYYHFLGTKQSDDILCWSDNAHPKWLFGTEVTDDGNYLILSIEEGCDPVNRLYYCNLSTVPGGLESFRGKDELLPFKKLVDIFEARYMVVTNDATVFTFYTNKNASRYKVVRVDLENADVWVDVVPESEKDVLVSSFCVNERQLLLCYLSDVKYVLQLRDLATGNFLQQLPVDIGSIHGVSGRRKEKEIFFGYTNFLTPGIIYQCNLDTPIPDLKIFHETVVKDFDRTQFETKQVFVKSKDDTEVPMFIVMKKNAILNGQNPALLYGYGGFSISITPFFSVSRVIFAQHCSGVLAIANIRGGGEYGEDWHRAGSLSKKQNCFDDFISCAEFLVNEGYTQPSKLAIEGGSNGGLLVAACINQRPDLFGCALAHVGVMDMLRFHKFTIGHAWTTEFGCSEIEKEFQWLIKYSPLHNVRRPWEGLAGSCASVQYPAIMLLTADHDDRVVPLHSLKLLATLQHELYTSAGDSPQTNPIIARIDTKAGHGAGRPTQKIIEEAADKFAFLAKVVDAAWIE